MFYLSYLDLYEALSYILSTVHELQLFIIWYIYMYVYICICIYIIYIYIIYILCLYIYILRNFMWLMKRFYTSNNSLVISSKWKTIFEWKVCWCYFNGSHKAFNTLNYDLKLMVLKNKYSLKSIQSFFTNQWQSMAITLITVLVVEINFFTSVPQSVWPNTI